MRPHVKTHQVPAIAHKQLAAGALGICCQKVTEADEIVAHRQGKVEAIWRIEARGKIR